MTKILRQNYFKMCSCPFSYEREFVQDHINCCIIYPHINILESWLFTFIFLYQYQYLRSVPIMLIYIYTCAYVCAFAQDLPVDLASGYDCLKPKGLILECVCSWRVLGVQAQERACLGVCFVTQESYLLNHVRKSEHFLFQPPFSPYLYLATRIKDLISDLSCGPCKVVGFPPRDLVQTG